MKRSPLSAGATPLLFLSSLPLFITNHTISSPTGPSSAEAATWLAAGPSAGNGHDGIGGTSLSGRPDA